MQFIRSENTGSLKSSSDVHTHACAHLHYPLGGVGALAVCVPVLLPTTRRWESTPWAHIRVPQVQVPVCCTPYWQSAVWIQTTNSVWQGGCSVWARQMPAEWPVAVPNQVLTAAVPTSSSLMPFSVIFLQFRWVPPSKSFLVIPQLLFNSSTVSRELIVFLFNMIGLGHMLLSFEYSTPPQLFTLTGLTGVVI